MKPNKHQTVQPTAQAHLPANKFVAPRQIDQLSLYKKLKQRTANQMENPKISQTMDAASALHQQSST